MDHNDSEWLISVTFELTWCNQYKHILFRKYMIPLLAQVIILSIGKLTVAQDSLHVLCNS